MALISNLGHSIAKQSSGYGRMRRGTKQRMLIGEFNEFHLESLREA